MRQEMENIKFVLLLIVALQFVRSCACQNSTIDFNVVEINRHGTATLACNVTSAGNLTRWTYLSGSTETILMSFQNGLCTVSPSNSFLSDDRFSYTCNSTVYQVTILPFAEGGRSIHNNILACRDALQPDMTDSTWIIKINHDTTTDCSYCEPKLTFNVLEVTEDNNVTFVCRVSSDVAYTNWNLNFGLRTATVGVQNHKCTTSPSAFLDNTNEYSYTCNKTVYQVTRLKVQRSEHKDMYMCTPALGVEGTGSQWIINVTAPVTSVVMTPRNYLVNVTENTTQRFTCTTSTARPAASVYWYIHTNGNNNDATQITENITTTTDYNDLSVTTSTLRFFPMRQHNNTKIFCKANNSLNTNQVSSSRRLLNVSHKADDPYINVSNEYRVIEHTQGTLSCSAKDGNPTPTLSWSCNEFSPSNQPTIRSNGNVTSTLTWTALRNQDGTCRCTSQQTGFPDETIDIPLVVLYPPSKPEFSVDSSNVVGDIKIVEGTTKSIKCTADSKPSPERYTWTSPTIVNPINSDTLILNEVKETDAGQYTCSVHNTMQPSNGGSVDGINSNNVNVVVLYLTILQGSDYRIIKNEVGLLSCSANSGHQTATLTWNCTNIAGVESTTSSGEIITNTLIWTTKRGQDGTCSCTSKRTGFPTSVAEVHVTVLHSPDYPTHFQYFDELSTSSSIQLAWNPGYNGGSQQTFYIKYKAIDLISWKYKAVPDNGKQTMIFTLTGLNANTFYQIIVLSTNLQGNSTESQPLLARTKELEQDDSPNLGPMVGGCAGGSIVFGVIMLFVGILIGRKVSCSGFPKKTSSSLKQSDAGIPTISSNTVAQYDIIGRENEYEMINKCISPSMPYTTLQPGNNLTQNGSRSDDAYENAI